MPLQQLALERTASAVHATSRVSHLPSASPVAQFEPLADSELISFSLAGSYQNNMKLFSDGVEFAAEVSPYKGEVPSDWGDGEITIFLAKAKIAFARDANWEIEKTGQRMEVAIRADGPAVVSPPAGFFTALFTAPAVG